MFDTHCHLQTEAFNDDLDQILASARAEGVTNFLIPAIDHASFPRTIELANREENIVFGLGIHPHSAKEWGSEIRDEIREEASQNPKHVAIGEIGLDYYYDFAPKDVQQRAFSEQIELAKELRKPIIIHTRESGEDVMSIVTEHYEGLPLGIPRGQFHCFSEDVAFMQKAVALGFHVSFTGNITFKKSTLADVVREVPLESVLLETDSPYLAPVPFRGKRNSPEYLRRIAEKVAEIKELDVSIIMHQTLENSKKLFLSSMPVALLLLMLFLTTFSIGEARAQRSDPVGNKPPDSVMTAERRKAEELLKKQREILAREEEQHRQDSIKQAQQEEQDLMDKMNKQAREDSTRAAERIASEEKARLKALTPITWKAIGVGGGFGIGNTQMSLSKPSLTPTSVLATQFQIGTQISRVLDLEVGFSHMNVGDDFPFDSVWNLGPNTNTSPQKLRAPVFDTVNGLAKRYVTSENIDINSMSFDLRWVITPRNAFKFYIGAGYQRVSFTNHQFYRIGLDPRTFAGNADSLNNRLSSDTKEYDDVFHRSAIKILFGMRYDIELGDNFILTPFLQIGAIGALQGENQRAAFVFQPDHQQITMTDLKAGVTMYFGWFGVERFK